MPSSDRWWRKPETFLILLLLVIGLLAAHLILHARPITVEYDLPTILLASASLSLLILSILVAFVAVFGWRELNRWIEGAVEAHFEEVHREYRGLIHFVLGLLFGRMCRTATEDEITVDRKDLLELAIDHTRAARELLSSSKDEQRRWKPVNNLAFYYALKGDPGFAKVALRDAEDLHTQYGASGDPSYLNTYARVVGSYYPYMENPRGVLRDTLDALDGLINDPNVAATEKKNARRHRVLVDRALRRVVERG